MSSLSSDSPTRPEYCRTHGDDVLLSVFVQPNAKRSECVGVVQGALKIKLHAPAVDGKANTALVAFVADALDVAPSRVVLHKGQTSRHKQVRVVGCSVAWVVERLT